MAAEYRWQRDHFHRFERDALGELLVADSWRSEAARVAAFGHHVARFEDAANRVAAELYDWNAVWTDLIRLIEGEGEASLFPRISVETSGVDVPRSGRAGADPRGTGPIATDPGGTDRKRADERGTSPQDLVLAIRPCPPARESTTLLVYESVDPRRSPRTKGPDIARLAAAKASALAATDASGGPVADDIILTDHDGALLEASTGSLVHWRDGRIVIANRFDRLLPSVTLRQISDRAAALGIRIDHRPVFANELSAGPLWFVNAVHGVSPVPEVRIGGERIPIPEHPDVERWQRWWWSTLEPMSAARATRTLDFP